MKILAIRGENLASLPAFAVDLESDPLAAAGLFAITGETGAGKSTMLDALCLALYGEYPRAAVSRKEGVADPSGEVLQVKDPRNILRRGAAAGFAEVDFVGRDGLRYRIRWEVRRARDRASGKLQKVERRLDRLDGDAATEPVAAGLSDVAEAVAQRTGLTFDQFRRTVLLAQGEFDAFLLADEAQRAELLEKITGTEVYGRISVAIHEATADKVHAIAEREAARGAVELLDQAQRAKLDSDAADADARARTAHLDRDLLARSLERARRQRDARGHLAAAVATRDAARAADRAADAERARLALLDRLAPVGAKAEAMRLAERAHTHASTSRADADKRATEAGLASAKAAVAWQKAIATDNEMQSRIDGFEALWREADQLDVQLLSAAKELADARAAATRASTEAQAGTSTLAGLLAEIEAVRGRLDALRSAPDDGARHALLSTRAAELAGELERHQRLVAALADARAAAARARAEALRIDGQVAIASKQAQDATVRRDAIAAELDQRKAQARASDLNVAEVQDRALAEVQDKLREAEAAARGWREAENRIVLAREAALKAREAAADAEERQRLAETDHERRHVVRREVATLADLAEATISEHAAALRSNLVTGEPCPVCGSADHPYLNGHGSADRLVTEIRSRRSGLDGEIAAFARQIAAARGDAAAARMRHEEASRLAHTASEEKARLAAAYSALTKPLAAALATSRLPHLLPATLDVRTSHTIAQIAADAEKARALYAHQLTAVRTLRQDLDRLQDDYAAVARLRDEAMARIEALVAKRRAAEQALAANDGLVREHEAAQAEVRRALEPLLAAADVSTTDLDADPSAVAQRITALAAELTARQGERQTLEARLAELTLRSATVEATHKSAADTARRSELVAEARQRDLDGLRTIRERLLGGQDTATHRASLLAQRTERADARAAAATAYQDLALAHASIAERLQAVVEMVQSSATELADARHALAVAVGALGLPEADALAMLALPPEDVANLRQRMDDLARAVADADRTHALRQADLDGLLADGDVTLDEAATETRLADLDRDAVAARQTAADARARLALDAAAREKVGALADEIEAARAELAVWRQVDAAVGSASGDRFRRFAQGVTLDHLVRLANLQLDGLDPRYRLGRSQTGDLGLHVVDRDMGDEVRAVRSLSGGERFLVSLALALALSGLEGRQSFVDTLFIDEGFGSLDADTLDTAIDALETLHSQGRKVGVITHVAGMIERIPVQIRVEKRGHGRSSVRVVGGETRAAA